MSEETKNGKSSLLFDIVGIAVTSVIIVSLAFSFLFRTVSVSGTSMFPTLDDKDRIILSAAIFTPETGDIVVTCQPSKVGYIEPTLVKRVIATGGQTVDIDFVSGTVTVDGKVLDEPYINEITREPEDFAGPLTVPAGYVFVMGDNRNASTDSRDMRVGLIREDYLLGKALFRLVPFGKFKIG